MHGGFGGKVRVKVSGKCRLGGRASVRVALGCGLLAALSLPGGSGAGALSAASVMLGKLQTQAEVLTERYDQARVTSSGPRRRTR